MTFYSARADTMNAFAFLVRRHLSSHSVLPANSHASPTFMERNGMAPIHTDLCLE
jgi:hypothetical protein